MIIDSTVLKTPRPNSPNMVHLAVDYQGVLRVANVEVFEETLRSGIGSAKAFGFGLLSIVPL